MLRISSLHALLLPLALVCACAGCRTWYGLNPVPAKAALAMMGRMTDEVRPPLYPMSAGPREKLREQLAALKLL